MRPHFGVKIRPLNFWDILSTLERNERKDENFPTKFSNPKTNLFCSTDHYASKFAKVSTNDRRSFLEFEAIWQQTYLK